MTCSALANAASAAAQSPVFQSKQTLLWTLSAICGAFASTVQGRFVADARLLDAHELLVLGPATAWIGDCMRRDPAKRDAYEFYSEDAPEAARSSARSFDRLWLNGTPLLVQRFAGVIASEAVQNAAHGSSIEASTRH